MCTKSGRRAGGRGSAWEAARRSLAAAFSTATIALPVLLVLMLGITMVAAPGVPGGAIMAAGGLLQGMLGFDETAVALMIATYIAIDSFGTATNVTGDGAIAVVMNKLIGRHTATGSAQENPAALTLSDAHTAR